MYKVFGVELSFSDYSSEYYYISANSIKDILDLFKEHLNEDYVTEEFPIYINKETYTNLTYKKNWPKHFKEIPNMFSDVNKKVLAEHIL